MADDDEWVEIIHPEAGTGTVSKSSLYQWYASGWHLLADDPPPEELAEPDPEPMTRAQARAAASTETKEN